MCRGEDMGSAEAKERAAFWGALCKLLLLMPSPAEMLAATALPEDWQLRAFGPLNAAHQRLEFQLPRAEKVGVAWRVCRAAAACLVCVLSLLCCAACTRSSQVITCFAFSLAYRLL